MRGRLRARPTMPSTRLRSPWPHPPSSRWWGAPLLLATLLVSASCGPTPPPPASTAGEPLIPPRLVPDPLVEQRRLDTPPSREGNRFLGGWWPASPVDGDEPLELLALAEGSRLEIVQLAARRRTLRLDFERAPTGLEAVLSHRGRELDRAALTEPVEIDLPADLPTGRVVLDLRFEPRAENDEEDENDEKRSEGALADPVVVAGSVVPVLPAGSLEWDGQDVVQSGWSRLDVVRHSHGPVRLLGSFVPPETPTPGQRFHLEREGEDGRVERLLSFDEQTWGQGFWGHLFGSRPASNFELDLGPREGFVRLRLVAEGEGPKATWRGLRWVDPAAGVAPPAKVVPAPAAQPPRLVVVYVMDALRADAVGHLGGPPGITPHLDRLASEGVTFTAHHAVAPNTLPSTLALFTGRTVRHAGQLGRLAKDGPTTLAEHFRAAGYTTALFSGNNYAGPSFGTDRGFDHVTVQGMTPGAPYNDNAEVLHRAALDWLAQRDREERLFLYFHVVHPHNPFAPPPELASPFLSEAARTSAIEGSTAVLLGLRKRRLTARPADQERLRGLYHGAQAHVDREIGELVRSLEERFDPADQLLAFTSDHGEELFDHGGVLHGYTLYQEMMRIPLVLWSPGRLPPRRVETLTDTLDFRSTLLALCGLSPEPSSEGHSLADGLISLPGTWVGTPGEEVLFASAASVKGGLYSARSQRWKVVRAPRHGRAWGMGQRLGRTWDAEYLFDLEADPEERTNLAGLGDLEAAWLRSRLLAWIDTRVETNTEEVELDAETRQQLEALGYL